MKEEQVTRLATIEESNNIAKSTELQRRMIKARTLEAGCQLMKQILPLILDEMSSQLLCRADLEQRKKGTHTEIQRSKLQCIC